MRSRLRPGHLESGTRLSLTYGSGGKLTAPIARGSTSLTAWENVKTPRTLTLAPPGGLCGLLLLHIAPRFGLAYSLTPQGDFVVRAGVGIFYDTGTGSTANLALSFPILLPQLSERPTSISNVAPFLPTVSLTHPLQGPGFQGSSPDLKLPRSYQWNVALEKSFVGQQAISVTYVGQAGGTCSGKKPCPCQTPTSCQGISFT